MIGAAARVMLLCARRDRAALLLAFALPPLVFTLFAAIFSGASGENLRLRVGVFDAVRSPTTIRLAAALAAEPGLRVAEPREVPPSGAVAAARAGVRRGAFDVALVIRGEIDPPPAAEEADGATARPAPPILVVDDPARGLAAPIVLGQVQRALSEHLPDVALARVLADVQASGAIAREERAFLEDAFRQQVRDRARSSNGPGGGPSPTPGGFAFAALFARDGAAESARRSVDPAVGYYAGAVAAVFLLFAALQGAATLLDERESGVIDRLNLGGGGLAAVLAGKFLFLVGQGMVQVGLVFLAAVLLFRAEIPREAIGPWLLTCALAAAGAAALALAVTAACATRRQAETLSTFGVLLLSAAGGSMVPRYLMPGWLQDVGWATPNAWMIEAFQAVLRPGATPWDALPAWSVLAGLTLVAAGLALHLSHRRAFAAP